MGRRLRQGPNGGNRSVERNTFQLDDCETQSHYCLSLPEPLLGRQQKFLSICTAPPDSPVWTDCSDGVIFRRNPRWSVAVPSPVGSLTTDCPPGTNVTTTSCVDKSYQEESTSRRMGRFSDVPPGPISPWVVERSSGKQTSSGRECLARSSGIILL